MAEVVSGFDAAERERVAALREQGRFFWLDVSLSETSLDDVVEGLEVPESAVQALPRSGDVYALRTFHADAESVVCALRCYVTSQTPADSPAYRFQPIDDQVLITADYLLTLHEERVSLPDALAPHLGEDPSKRYVVYSVLEAMVASTSDALDEIELRLDAFATTLTDGGSPRRLKTTLQDAGARLATLRRGVRAAEQLFERVGVAVGALDDFAPDDEAHFDRLDEEVDHLLSATDATINGMGMLLDLQLNQRAYVLSIVATVFVPLTFVTGFFGMNFGWMIDRVDTPIAFWLLGFTIPIAAGALSWRLFARRFVMGDGA